LPARSILEVNEADAPINEKKYVGRLWKPARSFRRPCQAEPDVHKATNVNFALTIGMLKLRRRLRSRRPVRRPVLTWEVLHIPNAPCLSGWRDHIRR
jgi:hypothetical protein